MKTKAFYITGFLALVAFDTLLQIGTKYAALAAGPTRMEWAWFLDILKTVWIYLSIAGYLGAFVTWMTLLRHAPVGPSFAASHLEIVTVTLLSIWLFHEPLTPFKAIGGLSILLGVLCLAKSREPEEKSP